MKHVRLLTGLILSVVLIFAGRRAGAAPACPLGPGETELSVSRIMRNFGRGTLKADAIARNGTQSADTVSNADLQDSLEGTFMAEACAAAVLEDRAGKLLPARADEFSGREREAYIAKYRAHMKDFADALSRLANESRALLALAPDRRDFQTFATLFAAVKASANQAHGDL